MIFFRGKLNRVPCCKSRLLPANLTLNQDIAIALRIVLNHLLIHCPWRSAGITALRCGCLHVLCLGLDIDRRWLYIDSLWL